MRIKTKVKNNQLIIRTRLQSKHIINNTTLGQMNRSGIRGLLKLEIKRMSTLEYTAPVGISLREYLGRPLSKMDFFNVVLQITGLAKNIINANFNIGNLLLDMRYVYININTKEMQYLYFPVYENMLNTDVVVFLESIACIANIDEKNTDFVANFVRYIKSSSHGNIYEIEEYLMQYHPEITRQLQSKNMGGSGFITNKKKEYYEHYQSSNQDDDEATGLLYDEEATGLLDEESTGLLYEDSSASSSYDEEATGLLYDEEATGLLNDTYDSARNLHSEGSEETTLLSEPQTYRIVNTVSKVKFPTLYRVKTGETISINKPVFRLGKEKSYVDYFISNNSAVSRGHADIVTRGERFFVSDQNSKNHTYINDEIIPIKIEVELFNGCSLRLANEEFVFRI